jgi:hypothetical protein
MRLNEFANAEAQLALLRIIIDNTWAAIAQQAAEKKRQDAERKVQDKLKPRSKKPTRATSTPIILPKVTPPEKPVSSSNNSPADHEKKITPDIVNSTSTTNSLSSVEPNSGFIKQNPPLATDEKPESGDSQSDGDNK